MLYFKLPFQEKIFSVTENSDNPAVTFVDFDGIGEIKFNGFIEDLSCENLNENFFSTKNLPYFKDEKAVIKEKDYLQKIENVVQFINENQLEKLVFSRRKPLHFKEINLLQSFKNLKENYPNAFVYLFKKHNVCWIGAFSEILGKYNRKSGIFETVSIAGTLPLAETWTNKEIGEQKTVTNFINNILENYCSNVNQSGTKNHISGNIKHLKTEFTAEIDAKSVENLIKKLHPTPAVCGIPKEFCRDAIKNFEDSDRDLYSGYIKIDADDFIYYFVNLRCAKIYKNTAVLYIGGGITKDSDAAEEWRETELKAQAIADNLIIS